MFFLDQKLTKWSVVAFVSSACGFATFFSSILKNFANKRNQDCWSYVRNIAGTSQKTIVQGIYQKKSQQHARGE